MDMEQIIDLSELHGKTIVACRASEDSGLLLLSFADKTYAVFEIERSYGDACDSRIALSERRNSDIPDKDKVAIGLMTAEELAEQNRKLQERNRVIVEQRQRQEYERLKAKFESSPAELT